MKLFRSLSLLTTTMTLVLMTIGAIVRVTKSGLGCGTDWPDCHGRLVPSLHTAAVVIEYSHRIAAALVGVAILALAIVAWLKVRNLKAVFWPSVLTLLFFPVQAWIGRMVVKGELQSADVVLHFLVSASLLGLLVVATANARLGTRGGWSIYATHGVVASIVSFAVLVVGALVSQFEAALAFGDWPLMDGRLIPELGAFIPTVHFTHRAAALALGITLAHLAVRVTKREPRDKLLLILGHGLAGLWLVQALIGGANVLTRSAGWAVVVHVVLAAVMWGGSLLFTVAAYRRQVPQLDAPPPGPPVMDKVKAYFFLTKPRIIELLLITTVPAMVLAEGGWPSWWLIAATLLGGSLTAGSANAINCFYDRDIDRKMDRTANRPLPRHQVEPRNALVFGIVLGTSGFVWLWFTVNLLAASLATAAILFYVFVYTIWMKRSTPSNIVIGGAAGAVPALVGWAAVRGDLHVAAWVMFGIIFYWTPPHFWALAIRYADDYRAAGVPMLPVVKGTEETSRQIILYSGIVAGVSLMLHPIAQLGIVYLTTTVVLNVALVWYALKLKSDPTHKTAMHLFHYSISYLVLLFVAIAVDPMLGWGSPTWTYQLAAAVSAALFLGCEGVLVASVLRGRSKGVPERAVMESVWTMLPVALAVIAMLITWQSGSLASP